MAIADLTIRKKGIFDLNAVYKSIPAFMKRNKFKPIEKTHKEKTGPHWGTELTYEWTSERKVTPYAKQTLDVNLYCGDTEEVEVIKNGKKSKMHKGNLKITITGNVTTDPGKMFKGSFWEKMKKIFETYLVKGELDTYRGEIAKFSYALYDKLQADLGLEVKG